jgi:hypothetical protein
VKMHLGILPTTLAACVLAFSPDSASAFSNNGGHSGHSFGGSGHSAGSSHQGGHSGGWAPRGGGGWSGWHHHDGGHFHGGWSFGFWGGPYWWDPWPWAWDYPSYYYAPYYAWPSYPAYVAPNSVPVPPSYWYYCPSARTYYPYVSQCPEAWVPVTPTPQQ